MMDFEREIERWAESVALRAPEAERMRRDILATPPTCSVEWWRRVLDVRGLPTKATFAPA